MQKLSVVIPTYRQENEIEKTVRSVLTEDVPDLEVIVVNDGSPDGTADVLACLSAEDSRLHVITKENAGVSAARNDGIRAATGDWLLTLDGDDYLEPGILPKMLRETEEEERPDLVITGMRYEYGDHSEDFIPKEFIGNLCEFTEQSLTALYDDHLITTHCNKLYDLGIIRRENLGYREDLAINEDIDFVARYLVFCKRIRVLPAICIHYVQHEADRSLIRTFRENGVSSSLTVLEDYEKLLSTAKIKNVSVLAGIRNRMLVHILSFLGILYRQPQVSMNKKREELENLTRDPSFCKLLTNVRPGDVKAKVAVGLLSRDMTGLYHFLCRILYRN